MGVVRIPPVDGIAVLGGVGVGVESILGDVVDSGAGVGVSPSVLELEVVLDSSLEDELEVVDLVVPPIGAGYG